MMNPEKLTRNKFVDTCMKIVPEDPVSQAQYMYYLSIIVFIGLLGFSLSHWYVVFTNFNFQSLFVGIFMFAISLLSLAGLKQTRNAYHLTKNLMSQGQPKMIVESVDEMMEEFNDVKNKQGTGKARGRKAKPTEGKGTD